MLVWVNGRTVCGQVRANIYLWHSSLKENNGLRKAYETNAMKFEQISKPKRIMFADKITECGTWCVVHVCYIFIVTLLRCQLAYTRSNNEIYTY